MFQTAMLLAFYGFLSVGEFTAPSNAKPSSKALRISNVTIESTHPHEAFKPIHVNIRFSKLISGGVVQF